MQSPITKTVELSRAYKWGTEEVKVIAIRKPLAKDLRAIPVGELNFGNLLDLAITLANQPKTFFDELEAEDGMKLVEAVSGFMSGGQRTGGPGSGV